MYYLFILFYLCITLFADVFHFGFVPPISFSSFDNVHSSLPFKPATYSKKILVQDNLTQIRR